MLRGVAAPLEASKGHAIRPTSYQSIRSISEAQGMHGTCHDIRRSQQTTVSSVVYLNALGLGFSIRVGIRVMLGLGLGLGFGIKR